MSENNTKRDRLLIELTSIERRLRKLYGDTYRAAVEIKAVRKAIEEGQEFTWDGNPAAAKQLQRLLDTMGQQTNAYLRNATSRAWTEGEEGVHNTLAAVFATNPKSEEEIERITEKAREDMRKRGASGHNYFNEKRGGLTISDRVWNISDTARNEIEAIIQNGILEGKNPDQIAKSVQPYLREPHKLFRRVRNKETGELELSQAAKKYKPGRGVYRSAYKNAMRLARTEVTAAYRRAEWETYQNNPLITGYRIELSNNHTTLVKGVPVPFHDICDEMVGVYPKTFLWTGWHPQCRCRMIPVFISKADFKDRMKALAAGKLKDWKPKSTTTDMPENFKKWIQDNSDRIAAARALPYWMQNNQGTINSILNQLTKSQGPTFKILTEYEIEEYKNTDRPHMDKKTYHQHFKDNGFSDEEIKEMERLFEAHADSEDTQKKADATIANEIKKETRMGKALRFASRIETEIYKAWKQGGQARFDTQREELDWLMNMEGGKDKYLANHYYKNIEEAIRDKIGSPKEYSTFYVYRKGTMAPNVLSFSKNPKGADMGGGGIGWDIKITIDELLENHYMLYGFGRSYGRPGEGEIVFVKKRK